MAVPRMELDLVNTIKVELEEEVEEVEAAEESDNNNTRLPEPEQPLALVKPRLERDITERFPYIDEVELQTNVRENFKITEKAQCLLQISLLHLSHYALTGINPK